MATIKLVCGHPGPHRGGTETPAASVPRHNRRARQQALSVLSPFRLVGEGKKQKSRKLEATRTACNRSCSNKTHTQAGVNYACSDQVHFLIRHDLRVSGAQASRRVRAGAGARAAEGVLAAEGARAPAEGAEGAPAPAEAERKQPRTVFK